ncbi:hypothetical protein HMPREF9948_0449 [Propionibacterium sp. 434-HC2]|nr:hypothetical protein HMPREF9948_0449 [Propionibacterium sp. 434-HC2]
MVAGTCGFDLATIMDTASFGVRPCHKASQKHRFTRQHRCCG